MTGPDFGALHAAMRKHVDDQLIPCVSTALLRGREAVDVFCYGFADREAVVPLRDDHIFRVFEHEARDLVRRHAARRRRSNRTR